MSAPPVSISICIYDASGSMRSAMREAAQNVCVSAIKEVTQGILSVRILDDASALNESEIVHLDLPPRPSCENPFAPRCRQVLAADSTQRAAVKAEAIERLRSATPTAARQTDLLGALAAAADIFGTAPTGGTRHLILATDLEDTRQRPAQLDLEHVDIEVWMQASAEPAVTDSLRAWFRGIVADAGAASLVYLPLRATQ